MGPAEETGTQPQRAAAASGVTTGHVRGIGRPLGDRPVGDVEPAAGRRVVEGPELPERQHAAVDVDHPAGPGPKDVVVSEPRFTRADLAERPRVLDHQRVRRVAERRRNLVHPAGDDIDRQPRRPRRGDRTQVRRGARDGDRPADAAAAGRRHHPPGLRCNDQPPAGADGPAGGGQRAAGLVVGRRDEIEPVLDDDVLPGDHRSDRHVPSNRDHRIGPAPIDRHVVAGPGHGGPRTVRPGPVGRIVPIPVGVAVPKERRQQGPPLQRLQPRPPFSPSYLPTPPTAARSTAIRRRPRL